jgi:hypothetical protein
MMLKDAVDDLYMVQNAQDIRRVLVVQSVEVARNHLAKAAIRPRFVANELRIGM